MKNSELKVRQELESMAEEKYKNFSVKLIPNCDNLIGVRIPNIRKIAKRIAKENAMEYLATTNEIYFEEIMLKGLVIGNMRDDIEIVLQQVRLFIPKINNWSVCDSFCNALKITKKHKARVWEFLKDYFISEKPYEMRFAVVMCLNYYIDEEYIDAVLGLLDEIRSENYYVKMAVAWAISMCFVKFSAKTMVYLKDNNLDKETYNKALQKIRESLKVDAETKEIIKLMKR